ncbi:MAG TPA: TlpA disulfide reductase family protein [Acidimicrobiales bacterium]|nr:TlpA disulfide reductase family protein [Acidimicrobiales bacterium]
MSPSPAAPVASPPVPPAPPTGPTGNGGVPGRPIRPRHTARWIGLAVLVIAAGLIAVLATRPQATTEQAASPLLGKQAPPVSGITVDGTHYSLPAQPGKYIVVNFFASWCVPCQTEGPNLVAFQFEHQRSGDASVLSVVIQDTVGDARSYQAKIGANWPTMADSHGKIRLDYGVASPPSTFVIAPDGRVVADYLGPATVADLDSVIQRAKASHP